MCSWNQRGIGLQQRENFNATSSRCFKCVEVIVVKKFYKAERDKLDNKLKTK